MPFFTHPTSFHNVQTPAGHFHLDASQFALLSTGDAAPMGHPARPPHSTHPALPHLTLLVIEAVLEVVCVSLPGYIVARQGMFTAEMQKFTANLNVMLFTPCLIFTKLASQLTADKLADLAIIPFIFLVQTLVSYLCSLLVSKLFGFAKRPRNFVIAMGVFGNSNSLPISLVISLSKTVSGLHWDKLYQDNDNEVQARGILYLLIFQQMGQMLRWSWGYNVLLAPPDHVEGTPENTHSRLENGGVGTPEEREALIGHSQYAEGDDYCTSGSDETRVEDSHASQSTPAFPSGAHTPITYEQHLSSASSSKFLGPTGDTRPTDSKAHQACDKAIAVANEVEARIESGFARGKAATKTLLQSIKRSTVHASSSLFGRLPGRMQWMLRTLGRGLKRLFAGVWQFMNPPLWAMLAAIIVASIPDLQRLFFAEGSFVKNSVTSAITQAGGVAVPLILVVLGGNLARNTLPSSSDTSEDGKEETKLLIAALISRMLLPFVIMAPLLALTAKYVPVSILGDPIFIIVCFLTTGAPSALQVAQICQINNVYMATMARLLFQSYVVWILPSTLVLVMCALESVEWARR